MNVFNNTRLFAVIALTLMAGCSEKEQVTEEKQLRPVRTMTVSSPDLNRTHEFTAVVDAANKADLSFKVSGEVTDFYFNQGQAIKVGQTIASLNDRDIKIKLDEAQSFFDKATADYNRAKNLISTNAISQSDFDQLKSQYNSTKAKLDAAKNNLEYTELKAPFSGVIARKYIQNFQEVKAGTPIVALHDLSNINLIIELPESIMIRVKRKEQPPKLTATFDAISNATFPLQFKEVATQADEVTKTYQVVLTMATPEENTILPGMTANVRAEHLDTSNGFNAQFYLPASVVQKDSSGNFVFTVKRVEQGIGEVVKTAVTAGDITELGIEIYAGLQQGDVVLTAGMSKVFVGQQVKF